ncbi:MAG: GntR family transcriptional regulator [Pseudomonadales bacterium]|nr:GntR family transcriptional regulator [Pseudomonadales bacterium]
MRRAESSSPLFAQVRDSLKDSIANGTLVPGDKLPSEADLEQRFGVSRVTVRQALADLQAQQVIEKINGKGSFVRKPQRHPSELGPLSGFYETMRRRGHVSSGIVSGITRIETDPTLAAAMRLPVSAPIGMLTITRLVDSEVHAFQRCYGSVGLLEAMVQQNLAENDLLTVLNKHLGYPIARSQIDFEAVNATAELAERLKTRVDAALLRIHITSYDGRDTPIMHNDFFARGDRFRYQLNAGV